MKEKEEDFGEELIDLNKNENTNEEDFKKNINNKNKIKNKKFLIFFIFIIFVIFIVIIIILQFHSYLKNNNDEIQHKSLIIFDFDKTITKKDVFEEQRYLLPTKEEQDELLIKIYTDNWVELMTKTYERFYNLNISISDIDYYIDKVEYTEGMTELFEFLRNKKNFILVILSAGHLYQINRVLQNKNLTNFFDEIIAFPYYIENGKIIIKEGNNYTCDICAGTGQCKTLEFNLLKDKYKSKNIIFDKVYYICDGINDYCLGRSLDKNDELLIRKNFTLDKYLYDKGFIKNIKCNIDKWNNGFDLIDYFKNLEN